MCVDIEVFDTLSDGVGDNCDMFGVRRLVRRTVSAKIKLK